MNIFFYFKKFIFVSGKSRGSPARAKMVRERKELGYERWKDKYSYGKRWIDETTFSSEIRFQYAMLNILLHKSMFIPSVE